MVSARNYWHEDDHCVADPDPVTVIRVGPGVASPQRIGRQITSKTTRRTEGVGQESVPVRVHA
jgi:hypothetical protein